MLKRSYIFTVAALITGWSAFAAPPDGATIANPIPLRQRDPTKAAEEEMQWMMKIHHYTPLLAERDEMAEVTEKAKRGGKRATATTRWGHTILNYNGHSISNWWFVTPQGKREIYFDMGLTLSHKDDVRQESGRGQYMLRMMPPLKAR
jgi:hypothetical protein